MNRASFRIRHAAAMLAAFCYCLSARADILVRPAAMSALAADDAGSRVSAATVRAYKAKIRPAGLSASMRGHIEKRVREWMAKSKTPGVSVAVVTGRKLRWAAGFGKADLEHAVPVRANTVFRLASISKAISAVAAMQLYEGKVLDLDVPVQKYVPEFPEKSWPVTSRQLLGHLSGIRHYKGDEITSTRPYSSVMSGLDIFKDDPLLHEPETKYTYTTYGYSLLGRVIENASGLSYMDYVRSHIFRPAGMTTARDDKTAAIIPHRAAGYRLSVNGELQNSGLADTSYKIPGGGLCATASDLAKFAIALMEGRLLHAEALKVMFTPLKTRDGKSTNYGLGWSVREDNGKKVVSHGGAQQRVSTILRIQPEEGLAVVVLSNLEGTNVSALAGDIADICAEPNIVNTDLRGTRQHANKR